MKEKHIEILEPMIMSSIMCFFMSLIMTWVHLGFKSILTWFDRCYSRGHIYWTIGS